MAQFRFDRRIPIALVVGKKLHRECQTLLSFNRTTDPDIPGIPQSEKKPYRIMPVGYYETSLAPPFAKPGVRGIWYTKRLPQATVYDSVVGIKIKQDDHRIDCRRWKVCESIECCPWWKRWCASTLLPESRLWPETAQREIVFVTVT